MFFSSKVSTQESVRFDVLVKTECLDSPLSYDDLFTSVHEVHPTPLRTSPNGAEESL